jgi:hypothetical protein
VVVRPAKRAQQAPLVLEEPLVLLDLLAPLVLTALPVLPVLPAQPDPLGPLALMEPLVQPELPEQKAMTGAEPSV